MVFRDRSVFLLSLSLFLFSSFYFLVSIFRVGLSLVPFLMSIFNPEPKMPIHSSTSALISLLLSGPPFFAALRGTAHLAPRSLRQRSPVRADLRAKVLR